MPLVTCVPMVWTWSRFATRLRWVSTTPLARPVVPDEYGSAATSSPVIVTVGRSAVVVSRSASAFSGSGVEASSRAASSRMISETTTPSSATAARARSRNAEIVTRIFEPESRSWKATSSGE